jgi:IclR family transcriptional regulator, KDG regulon repressor
MDLAIGRLVPCYCTAVGKVILANRPEMEVQKLFHGVKFQARTPTSIVKFSALLKQLREIRQQKYAVDNEELTLGLRCVAYPIFGYTGTCVAAISIAGPSLRMTDEKIEKVNFGSIIH